MATSHPYDLKRITKPAEPYRGQPATAACTRTHRGPASPGKASAIGFSSTPTSFRRGGNHG